MIISVVLVSKKIKEYYARIENRFLTNLNSEGGRRSLILPRELADEIHIEKVEVEPNSFMAGKTISQIHRSKQTGALVIQMIRGLETIDLPANSEIIFPMDILIILGTDKQMMDFKEAAEEKVKPREGYHLKWNCFRLPWVRIPLWWVRMATLPISGRSLECCWLVWKGKRATHS
jgi:CPA2 family monovalent cation:H+ antiporter-2